MKTATIATLPDRHDSLLKTVDSLLPQVDSLYIRRDTDGIGDEGKFTLTRGEYIFRCDDDIIYPDDYVEYMISKIEEYNRKAVISCHGKVLKRQPIESYYGGDFDKYHFRLDVEQDTPVHLVGTGVLAYHKDTLSVSTGEFEKKNMADVWFSIACEKQGVERIVCKHKANWLRLSSADQSGSCWEWNKERDQILTEAINSIKWQSIQEEL